ncbi:MAG: hypothetical protein R3E65_12085 [Steroidobacteraceae bacterium]
MGRWSGIVETRVATKAALIFDNARGRAIDKSLGNGLGTLSDFDAVTARMDEPIRILVCEAVEHLNRCLSRARA